MATRKKNNNIGAFGHPIYGKGFAKYGEMQPNGTSEIQKDLEEAADEYANKHYSEWDESWDDYNGHNVEPENDKLELIDAFIAGAEWQAEHTPLPEDTVIWNDGFKTGREVGERDMKEQMLKDAVEGIVCATIMQQVAISFLSPLPKELKAGDKIRVIILKRED